MSVLQCFFDNILCITVGRAMGLNFVSHLFCSNFNGLKIDIHRLICSPAKCFHSADNPLPVAKSFKCIHLPAAYSWLVILSVIISKWIPLWDPRAYQHKRQNFHSPTSSENDCTPCASFPCWFPTGTNGRDWDLLLFGLAWGKLWPWL